MEESEIKRLSEFIPRFQIKKTEEGEFLYTDGMKFKVIKTKEGYEYYLYRLIRDLPENPDILEKLIGDKNERIPEN